MRRWGDRRDGTLIRDLDSMHYIMPLMYPNRCDNEAYMTINIHMDKIDDFLKRKNAERDTEIKYNIFQLVVAATLKTLRLRPEMNRFIANKNVYQRNELTAAFTVKRTFSDSGNESLARIVAEDTDTIDTLHRKVNDQIEFCKNNDDESTDAMNVIQKLPGKHAIGAVARFLDRHGWMPKSVIATDPYQCSVVLTNLGSIGLNVGYHHLMNWGTNSVFVVVGKKKKLPVYDASDDIRQRRILELSMTIDERLADGYYYARTLKLLKKLLENPELLERPLSEPVVY